MKVVTFSDSFSHECWAPVVGRTVHFEPGKPYLLSNKQMMNLTERKLDGFAEKVSAAEPALREFNVATARKGQSILLYNGCGGMGDAIMAWPLARILSDEGFRVHVLAEPHLEFAWQGFPWVETILLLPCYWKMMDWFDHHAFFEFISNSYFHEGQEHPVDHSLRKMGFDPSIIARERKVLPPQFTPMETRFASWLYPGSKIAFFQLKASQQARSLPAFRVREIFSRVAVEFPEFHWIGIAAEMDDYALEADPGLPNTEVRKFHRLRLLWALMQRAELVIAPDSMAVHMAGSMGIPCVGLWGIYAPEVRTAYYHGHVPVFHKEACPSCPCNWNYYGLPTFCPPVSRPPRTTCAVLEAVSADEVVEAAKKALDLGKFPMS
jgi:ADP-heptose:LPS heptosyltransferase